MKNLDTNKHWNLCSLIKRLSRFNKCSRTNITRNGLQIITHFLKYQLRVEQFHQRYYIMSTTYLVVIKCHHVCVIMKLKDISFSKHSYVRTLLLYATSGFLIFTLDIFMTKYRHRNIIIETENTEQEISQITCISSWSTVVVIKRQICNNY